MTPKGRNFKKDGHDHIQRHKQLKQLVVAQVRLWCRLIRLTIDRLHTDRGRTAKAHGFFIGAVENSMAPFVL